MNFERLLKLIANNYLLIKNKQNAIYLLKHFYELSIINKNKLKTGRITFILNEPDYKKYKFIWEMEIKFSNYDVYLNKSKVLQNLIDKFEWKWDRYNILAFLLVFFFFCFQLYCFIYKWYLQHFTLPLSMESLFLQITVFVIKNIFNKSLVSAYEHYVYLNDSLVSILIEFTIKFSYLI
uniref:Uncharacterized protein n=1 Tax=Pseudourostyla cristata TaxID=293816 RepID=A0A4P9JLA0_9SPIT|nr:hypothetical protein [Pseudourostyla cristata]